jgi:phage shock protein PspC (stress-responsive transcriptional regulator)
MKKVININLASRVIPIEDTAYETLKQYLDSLRRYFANEEGRDEIIADIEARIAEIFSDKVKKGASCINDEDVAGVITNMGRPEDFEEAEAGTAAASSSQQKTQQEQAQTQTGPRKLYRDVNDKILGGVCSGLAAYFNIDPAIIRIIFVLMFFTGVGFLLYITLWVVVPSASVNNYVKKRLYRDPDNKMIAGVCSGLASYLNISVSWVRVVFLAPLILAAFSHIFDNWGWPFAFIGNGGFGSFFLAYLVLWIVVPTASTAAEKLEMRGEKVDIQNIKNTIKSDLESFKGKAKEWGSEMKDTVSSTGAAFASEAAPAVKRSVSGLGRAIGIIFKIFFFVIVGVIAFALFMVLIALFIGGVAVFPVKDFFLGGFWPNFYVYGTLLFFLAVPIIALITTIIRRIMGVKRNNRYLGYTFGVLWTLGWICVTMLVATSTREFKSRKGVVETIALSNPGVSKLYVAAEKNYSRKYDYDQDEFWGINFDGNNPFFSKNHDSMMLKTVRIDIQKSTDSLFHVLIVKLSRGNTIDQAEERAQKISFPISQTDSLLTLPHSFAISKNEKFRNQQVIVMIQVPVGKKIELARNTDHYDWFNININNRRGWDENGNEYWDYHNYWEREVEYIMTPDGLKKTRDLDQTELKKGRFKMIIDGIKMDIDVEDLPEPPSPPSPKVEDNYRYNPNGRDTASIRIKTDKGDIEIKTGNIDNNSRSGETSTEVSAFGPVNIISKLFHL